MSATNELIGILTETIPAIERHEIGLLEFIAERGPELGEENERELERRLESAQRILCENIELMKTIHEKQTNGDLRFLDPVPFRNAILRLKAAIAQAETVM